MMDSLRRMQSSGPLALLNTGELLLPLKNNMCLPWHAESSTPSSWRSSQFRVHTTTGAAYDCENAVQGMLARLPWPAHKS